MGRGSIQLRHRQGCPAKGRNSRACRCGPTVWAVLDAEWARLGYLERRWRQADLDPFNARLVEMRNNRLAGGSFVPPTPPTLAEYASKWFAELYEAALAGRISKLTYNTYESVWATHLLPALGTLLLTEIDARAIRRYVVAKQAQGLAPSTINNSLTPLSAMLTDAVAEGLIPTNPARQPRRARHGGSRRAALYVDAERPQPKHLEPHEARALLAATQTEYRVMVLAALATGFRRGELLGLRWEDIQWADRRIELRGQLQDREYRRCKCGSEREVVLYSGLARELGKRRQAQGYIFTDDKSKPWGNQGPERAFLRAAYEAAGLRRPGQMWHLLRHTYASILANGGIKRDAVEALMGHKPKGTTAIYTHLFKDAYEGVEEALDAVFGVAASVSGTPHAVATVA